MSVVSTYGLSLETWGKKCTELKLGELIMTRGALNYCPQKTLLIYEIENQDLKTATELF